MKLLSQVTHLKDFSPSWTIKTCLSKWSLRKKPILLSWHFNFFKGILFVNCIDNPIQIFFWNEATFERPVTIMNYWSRSWSLRTIELLNNKLHGLSAPGGFVSLSGGFSSLLFDQVGHFASIKLCLALSRQGAEIKIPVVRCHCLLCLGPQYGKNVGYKFSIGFAGV